MADRYTWTKSDMERSVDGFWVTAADHEALAARLAEAERFLNTAHALICQAVARRNIGEITPLPTHDEMRAWLMNYADRATVSASLEQEP